MQQVDGNPALNLAPTLVTAQSGHGSGEGLETQIVERRAIIARLRANILSRSLARYGCQFRCELGPTESATHAPTA